MVSRLRKDTMRSCQPHSKQVMHGRTITGTLTVDCANGVGGPKLTELIKYLPSAKEGGIDIKVVNDDVVRPEALNYEVSIPLDYMLRSPTRSQCGADYVKTKQRAPPKSNAAALDRCCSLDGDADRLVYYYTDEQKTFHLLGRRPPRNSWCSLHCGNGSQRWYRRQAQNRHRPDRIRQRCLNRVCRKSFSSCLSSALPPASSTSTTAAARFDVGVYFEANGHGTVVFSDSAIKLIRESEPKSPGQKYALESLRACIDLINQAVGDALSDMLFAEVVLAHKCWSPRDWENTYIDLPNRLVRVEVHDRSIFKATDAERKLESPKGAQDEIDKLQQLYIKGRAFARASGTEDAVRVYAEAHSKTEADKLASQVAEVVQKFGRT